jgi:predicted transcriptional regulator
MADPKTLHAPTLLVQDMMTLNVHKVLPEMKVYQAIEMLTRHMISGAPIANQSENLISVLSEGDLLRLAAVEGLEATIAHCLPKLPETKKLITLEKHQSFADAYKLFLKHSLHRIVVIDGNGRINGIVTRADILRLFVEARHGKKIAQDRKPV